MTLTPSVLERFGRGLQHQSADESADAEACFRDVIEAEPACAPAWSNLGLVHERAGRWHEALACYRQAQALEPGLYEPHINAGVVLNRLKRFDEAEASWRRALGVRPAHPLAWTLLGSMLACLGRHEEAQALCAKALSLNPHYTDARFNLAYSFLRQGRFAEGLLCHEARDFPQTLQARLNAPRWAGEPLQGRRLLVVSDAGHGDLIQMARYATLLRELGAGRLLLHGQPPLKRLMSHSALFDDVSDYGEPLDRADWDLWTPSMSLPYLLGTTLDTVPARLPYLRAYPREIAIWDEALRRKEGARPWRVGLVYRGDPRHENDPDRSIHDLGILRPLTNAHGIRWISLQCGPAAQQTRAERLALGIEDPDRPLQDFADTAALIGALDLVLAVDTSTAHLAAALGTPTWVMLPAYKTDWRWMEARADSPWYPGVMQLFRQERIGQWEPVIQAIRRALNSLSPLAPQGPGTALHAPPHRPEPACAARTASLLGS